MNYSRFINKMSAARRFAQVRPSVVLSGSGWPNSRCWPIEEIELKTKDHGLIEISDSFLKTALQYGPSGGTPVLVDWLKEILVLLHQPATNIPDWKDEQGRFDVLVTAGSNSALAKIFAMVLNDGDSLLLDDPSYGAVFPMLRPRGINFVAVDTDDKGIVPSSLEEKLAAFDDEPEKKPKLLYTQPNSSNPTGVAMPLNRRLETLEVCHKHDVLVIEDDPYYFLQFQRTKVPPSLMSLDTDGRIVRLGSFSKIMSAGIRIGFVSGPKVLIDRLNLHVQAAEMQSSSLSQVVVLSLLQKMGVSGFLEHVDRVGAFYEDQCNKMMEAAKRHLTGLAEWRRPDGGMFVWLKCLGVADSQEMVTEHALDAGVVLVPGSSFFCDDTKPSPFLRACYSNVNEEQMDEGMKRLAQLIRQQQEREAKNK